MKREIKIVLLSLLVMVANVANVAYGQAPTDAYRNAKQGIHGTARAQGLSGAVGAIGADPTAIYVNPAGIGLYQRSITTLSFDFGRWTTDTTSDVLTATKNDRLRNFNHFSYFGRPWSIHLSKGGYLTFNLGFAYDKSFDYNRDYELQLGEMPGGLSDLMLFRAWNEGLTGEDYWWDEGKYDPFMQPVDPMVVMGVNSDIIGWYDFVDDNGVVIYQDFDSNFYFEDDAGNPLGPLGSQLNVSESGGKHDIDFINFGMGYNDWLYLGTSLRLTSYNYNRASMYFEDYFVDLDGHILDGIEYGNSLSVQGEQIGMNFGALVALGDYGRVGISYLTPQYGSFDELYRSTAKAINQDFDKDVTFDSGELRSGYSMQAPGQLTLSAMLFLSRYGFVTYDYQYRDLGQSRLYAKGTRQQLFESQFILEDYGKEHTHKFGIELRPISWLSLRGGYSHTNNPMVPEELRHKQPEEILYPVPTSGMMADFTVPMGYHTYSAGVGINLGKAVVLDMSWVRSSREMMTYPLTPFNAMIGGDDVLLGVTGGITNETRNYCVTTFTIKL